MAPWGRFPNTLRWRDALVRLALKELKVRYKSPALGMLWAFIVPAVTSMVLTLVFGRLMVAQVAGAPYALFLLVAVFPWNCVQSTLMAATTCIQDNAPLIRQAVFPRQLLPLAVVLANLINFMPTLLIVCGIAGLWQVPPRSVFWLLPCAVGLQVAFTTGLALFLAALQADFRDTKYIVDVALLVWFYLTPMIYPASMLAAHPVWGHVVLLLNPMTGLVSLYRVALLGPEAAGLPSDVGVGLLLWCATLVTAGMGALGWVVFARRSPQLADMVRV